MKKILLMKIVKLLEETIKLNKKISYSINNKNQ